MCAALGLTSSSIPFGIPRKRPTKARSALSFWPHLPVSFSEGDIYQLAGECVVLLARILANNLRPSDWG